MSGRRDDLFSTELAAQVGIHQGMSKIDFGKGEVSPSVRAPIADVLSFPPTWPS